MHHPMDAIDADEVEEMATVVPRSEVGQTNGSEEDAGMRRRRLFSPAAMERIRQAVANPEPPTEAAIEGWAEYQSLRERDPNW